MSGILAQLGCANETTYGTPITPTRFFEFTSESMALDVGRIDGEALRANTRVQRSDRWAVNRKGAAGDVDLPVLSRGMGYWLVHMLGTVATTGPTDSAYTHTGTIGDLTGDFFTLQVGRPLVGSTVQPFTYHGCKVTQWELSGEVDAPASLKLSIDAEDEDTSTALAAASYPAAEMLTFVGGRVQIGAVDFAATSATVSCENNLKTDRYFLRDSSLKREPLENGLRNISFSIDAEDEDTSTALAAASYPAAEMLTFVGGRVQIGAVDFAATSATVSCENNLKTDRYFLRDSSLKREPLENGLRNISFSIDAEFENLTQYNRYASATAAGAQAAVELRFRAPTLIGATTFPELRVSIPVARFDGATPNVGGPDLLTQSLSGRALFDGTNSAVTVTYVSTDITP